MVLVCRLVINLKPEGTQEVIQMLDNIRALVIEKHHENTMINIGVDTQVPGRIYIYQEWNNKEAFFAFLATQEHEDFKAKATEFSTIAPDVKFFEADVV